MWFFLLHRASNWHFKDVPATRVGLYTGYLRAGEGILRAVSPLCSLHNVTLSPFVAQSWSVFNAKLSASLLAALYYFFMNNPVMSFEEAGTLRWCFTFVRVYKRRLLVRIYRYPFLFYLEFYKIIINVFNLSLLSCATDISCLWNILANVRYHSRSLVFIVLHLRICLKSSACHGLGKFM